MLFYEEFSVESWLQRCKLLLRTIGESACWSQHQAQEWFELLRQWQWWLQFLSKISAPGVWGAWDNWLQLWAVMRETTVGGELDAIPCNTNTNITNTVQYHEIPFTPYPTMEYNTSNCHGRGRRSKYFQTCLSRLAVANSLQVAVKIVAVENKKKEQKRF